jgi:hypothetical protein
VLQKISTNEMDLTNIENFSTEKDDTKCIRFLKRKFKCVIIYMLLVISLIQLIVIICEKMDDKYLNIILEKIMSKNQTI